MRALAIAWCLACASDVSYPQAPAGGETQTSGEALLLEELARRGARIGKIEIAVDNVFDTSNPDESKRLYRWANRVHVKTREDVIEDVLLFAPGDRFDPRLLEESARLLRSRDFLVEATATPSAYHAESNTVDILVNVRDGWSLSPELELGRNGGENEVGLGVEESNLLGTGKGLTVSYTSDVDRDEAYFGYTDPNVRGSRARLDVVLANLSDGERFSIAAGRPFFALDTRWSVSGAVVDDERVETIYDLGEEIDEFRHRRRGFSVEGGWSRGLEGRRALRWLAGFTYAHDEFAPTPEAPDTLLLPPDRKLVYPWVGFQLIEDDFRVMTELNDIGRTEDVPLGLNLTASVGFSSESLGADRDATLLNVGVHKGWEVGPGRLLLVDASGSTRREDGEYRNTVISAGGRYYHRNLGGHLFLASLYATATNRLDPELQVLLGGDNGLRGYPLRYQAGEQSAALTLEQRFFTDWYPLRLFRVGYAVFFDAGRVWGEDPRATPSLGDLYDFGVGLRLTSPRSSSRQVVHIDLAFPIGGDETIDDVQLTIETKRSF
ncbi:MAG TPA: BamA/TamA family outer membrane protein [Gammaproteobacteria bacterium]